MSQFGVKKNTVILILRRKKCHKIIKKKIYHIIFWQPPIKASITKRETRKCVQCVSVIGCQSPWRFQCVNVIICSIYQADVAVSSFVFSVLFL